MINSTSIKESFLPMPIGQSDRQIAQQFAHQVQDRSISQQIYFNTLAVLVVNHYLQLMGIETDLKSSESWNQVLRLSADIADLKVVGLGHLECRPVQQRARICHIPPDVWEDRIGYVVVEIDESLKRATLLGFSQTVETGELVTSKLQPLEALLNHLHQLRHPVTQKRVNLSQWLQNFCASGWQTVGEIIDTLGGQETPLAYRSRSPQQLSETDVNNPKAVDSLIELLHGSRDQWTCIQTAELLGRIDPGNQEAITALTKIIQTTQVEDIRRQAAVSLGKVDPGNLWAGARRAKVINSGLLLAGYRVTLAITIMPETDNTTNVHLRVYPTEKQVYLPANLQLIVLDESGETFLTAESRNADNWIQLEFSGSAFDTFRVQISVADVSWQEDFVI